MQTTQQLIENSQGKTVRLEDIAQEAGVSRQAIYLHFGSRTGLMISTVQHIDEVAGFKERTQHVRDEEDSLAAIELFVEFWAEYVPTIYGVAKQLNFLRETDEGAAAAWHDRMGGLRNGVCRYLVERLKQDGQLDPVWQTETAIDVLWMLLSIQTWENLVNERGWSADAYAANLNRLIQQVLITKT